MYLNIVNNLSFENKRNNNTLSKRKEKSDESEDSSIELFNIEKEIFYNSIFYGQLTQNWLKVTS